MRRSFLLAILVTLWLPSGAFAGSASLTVPTPEGSSPKSTLSYTASPGERNEIVATRELAGATNAVVLHDGGADVVAGPGCTAIDARTVRCAMESAIRPDGNSPQPVPAIAIYAGDGDDTLTGAGTLSGGPGRDMLTVSGLGNDVIDGGADRDTLSYAARSMPVRVDLARGTADGAGGEHDRLSGIEDVIGGAGDDLLLGDGERNQLTGGAGDDRLDGRGGNDRLNDIGPGADTLRGGAGDDKLYAPGRRDRLFGGAGNDVLSPAFDGGRLLARTLHCGSGSDHLRGQPQGQLVSGCEWVDLNPPHIGPRLGASAERRDGGLRFRWSCYGPDILIGCRDGGHAVPALG